MEPAPARHAADIRLGAVSRVFPGGVAAVDDLTLEIPPGAFFSLLGPSGCGKTTTLRMIAGFERPDRGRVLVGGRDVTDVPVHRRDMGMVFQSYALLPHRTVAENVAFGLRMRGMAAPAIAARVSETLAQVRMGGFEDRLPSQLSGGQQQRVALARSLAIRPPVLLCDEPLGALDRKLRQAMQVELKELQHALGPTLVFVTHDQEEALAMSDLVAVMNAGRIEQVGAPAEIYDRPRTRFVAEFIGEIVLFEGRAAGGRLVLENGAALPCPPDAQGRATLALRPEKLRLVAPGAGVLDGVLAETSFLGGVVRYHVGLPDGRRVLVEEGHRGAAAMRSPGAAVAVAWGMDDGVVLEDRP